MTGLSFYPKLDWSSYIISMLKLSPTKIEALIRSMKFLFPKVALYLYKSTNSLVWNTVVMPVLMLLVATGPC